MSDPNVYTAERILAKRKHHGVTQYHIKWKGYSLKDSTWEPAENILDPTLLINFERSNKNKKSSATSATNTTSNNATSSSSNILNSSESSSNASSLTHESRTTAASTLGKAPRQGRVVGRRRSYLEQRQEQLQLQRHIELQQQQQKTHSGITSASLASSTKPASITTSSTSFTKNGDKRPQLLISNPEANQEEQTYVEQIYEPKLTKEPVLVTDVTSQDLTVTISECRTPDGFFRT